MPLDTTLTGPALVNAAIAAYVANTRYASNNSLSQAQDFAEACDVLLLLRPSGATQDRGGMQFDNNMLKQRLDEANQFIANNPSATGGGGGGNRHFSFNNLRDCGGWQ